MTAGTDQQQAVELRPGQAPPGFIEVDGSKSPLSIPDWVVWGSTLRLLADASGNEASQFYAELQLSSAERTRVVDVALAQNDRDRTCEQRILALGERLKGVEVQRILALTQQEQIRCRVETLDAAEDLLANLSPSSARRLQQFVDDMRSTAQVWVPREGLAHFKRPR